MSRSPSARSSRTRPAAATTSLTGNASGNPLRGAGGSDSLNGAAGSDWLEGGGGGDVFVFTAAGHSSDYAPRSDGKKVLPDLIERLRLRHRQDRPRRDRRGRGNGAATTPSPSSAPAPSPASRASSATEVGDRLCPHSGDVDGDGLADLHIIATGTQILATTSFLRRRVAHPPGPRRRKWFLAAATAPAKGLAQAPSRTPLLRDSGGRRAARAWCRAGRRGLRLLSRLRPSRPASPSRPNRPQSKPSSSSVAPAPPSSRFAKGPGLRLRGHSSFSAGCVRRPRWSSLAGRSRSSLARSATSSCGAPASTPAAARQRQKVSTRLSSGLVESLSNNPVRPRLAGTSAPCVTGGGGRLFLRRGRGDNGPSHALRHATAMAASWEFGGCAGRGSGGTGGIGGRASDAGRHETPSAGAGPPESNEDGRGARST